MSSAPPIFVHSGARTGSTWLWTRFRESPEVVAYYEYFHELLATIKAAHVSTISPTTWRSHHPDSAPYFLEFMPLMTKGVVGYRAEMAFDRFIPGPEGLSIAEASYVQRLIELASETGKTAVLTETRTLGRAGALKRSFGGFHILLTRNLFQQWCSYSNQRLNGNNYFHEALFRAIDRNSHDPYFRFLSSQPRESEDDAFCIFAGYHLYLTMQAAPECDLLIEVNRLDSASYRRDIEQALFAAGAPISLSGAQSNIECPLTPISDLARVQRTVASYFDQATRTLSAGDFDLGRRMLKSLWREQALFQFYSRSTREHFEAAPGPSDTLEERASATDQVARPEGYEEAAMGEQIILPPDVFASATGDRRLGRIKCSLASGACRISGRGPSLGPGKYVVDFELEHLGLSEGVVVLEIRDEAGRQRAIRHIDPRQSDQSMSLEVETEGGALEFRVDVSKTKSTASLHFFGVRLTPLHAR